MRCERRRAEELDRLRSLRDLLESRQVGWTGGVVFGERVGQSRGRDENAAFAEAMLLAVDAHDDLAGKDVDRFVLVRMQMQRYRA